MSLELETRLRAAGLSPDTPVVPHTNRRVLVTLTRRGALRVHAGYRFAPDPVLAAIARWARPRLRRAERLAAGRILAAFPVHAHIPPEAAPRRRPRPLVDPGDAARLERLGALHALLNARHFGGVLGQVELRLSARMRRRLGEFRPGSTGEPVPVITLSRRHLRRDGWSRATDTLLHEMVHQWQAENGRPLGHGAEFRLKCAELGIEGRAVARSGSIFCP
ncbi:MAG TPA: SprT-like domain-containing protein [Gemmatimonadales bacterium]|nr:SprT-like domain-containing protein [Gemmatimonadales bacterium]